MLADGGRREEEEIQNRRSKGRGRVGEEDRAGGEGESEDSCADYRTLLTFLWAREVSKDERNYRNAVGVIDLTLFSRYLPVVRSWKQFVNSMNSVHSQEREKKGLPRVCLAVFTSTDQ